jgi:hypothetical protein
MDNPANQSPPLPQQPGQQQQQSFQQPAQQQPAPQAAPSQANFSVQAQNPAQYGVRVVDSLSANEFHIEINGQIVTGVFAVNGLTPFCLQVDEAGKPVGIKYPPLIITKMVQQDPTLPFNAWVREAVQARGSVLPTREIAVVAMDEGTETRRWVYGNAWISEVSFSDFDTALEYLVEEKITIRHGGVEEIWPNG